MDCPEGGTMFLKLNIFKKILKKAWNGCGLFIGCKDGQLYMSGGWWCVKILKENLEKKEKAALIELVGELPEEGEAFKAFKDSGNQYEIGNLESLERLMAAEYKQPVNRTKLIYQIKDKKYRVFQEQKLQNCIFASEIVSELIDEKVINLLEETVPEGPFTCDTKTPLYWENNVMSFLVLKINTDEDEETTLVKQLLENTELPKIGA